MRADPAVSAADREAVLDAGMRAIREIEAERPLAPSEALAFEAIQVFDGTRPAIALVDGRVPLDSPELGRWVDSAVLHGDEIARLGRAVGKVMRDGAAKGTAFVAGPGVVLTNRHVLETIGDERAGRWRLAVDAAVHFDGSDPLALTGVAYAGPERIGAAIDLSKLDGAALRVEPGGPEPAALNVPKGPSRLRKGRFVHVIGFPLDLGDTPREALRLYAGKLGRKCWSPGVIEALPGEGPHDTERRWAFRFDASTLPGNSGSAVGDLESDPGLALGLHIGGRTLAGNWAHALSETTILLHAAGALGTGR